MPGGKTPSNTTLLMRFAVDRERERLAHAAILAQRALGAVAVADVDRQPLVAERYRHAPLQAIIGVDRGDVGRRQALEHVEIAGAQVGQAHRGVGDRQEGHGVKLIASAFQ